MGASLQHRFDAALDALFEGPVPKAVLAVSGGIDSMALASLCLHSNRDFDFAVANADFCLRGEESAGDQAFVRQWCRENGIRCFTAVFDTASYASRNRLSIEMAARELRYDWFERLLEEEGYNCVMVAHNMDDNAETMLLHLLRGTGIAGMHGIKPVNGRIVRPLLGFSRQEIAAYAESVSLSWREDSTNAEAFCHRNHIRNNVFPLLKQINPSFKESLQRSSRYFAQAENVLSKAVQEAEGSLYLHPEGTDAELLIDTAALRERGNAGFWLFHILNGYGFTPAQIASMEKCLESGNHRSFASAEWELLLRADSIRLYSTVDGQAPTPQSIPAPGTYPWFGGSISLEIVQPESITSLIPPKNTLYLDAGTAAFPLTLRAPQDSDRIRPLGMKRGSRLVSDALTSLKLDIRRKSRTAVLCSGEGDILALAPHIISEQAKVRPDIGKIFKITIG